MTAQDPETVRIDGKQYALCGVSGEGLFNPQQYGLETAAPHTACWRGYVCGYAVVDKRLVLDDLKLWSTAIQWPQTRSALVRFFGDRLLLDDDHHSVTAQDLGFVIPFTGALMLGDHLIPELNDHMGFHPAYKYQDVLELTFESGYLLSQSDRSFYMAEVRLNKRIGDSRDKHNETDDPW